MSCLPVTTDSRPSGLKTRLLATGMPRVTEGKVERYYIKGVILCQKESPRQTLEFC